MKVNSNYFGCSTSNNIIWTNPNTSLSHNPIKMFLHWASYHLTSLQANSDQSLAIEVILQAIFNLFITKQLYHAYLVHYSVEIVLLIVSLLKSALKQNISITSLPTVVLLSSSRCTSYLTHVGSTMQSILDHCLSPLKELSMPKN